MLTYLSSRSNAILYHCNLNTRFENLEKPSAAKNQNFILRVDELVNNEVV